MPILLSQNTLRIALLPANVIIFIVCVTISAYLGDLVPKYQFTSFVFWLLKPCLHVQLMMTCIILIVGLAGNIRYSKCWQGSYTFFVFILTVINGMTFFFSKDLLHSADTVIPKLDTVQAYQIERFNAFSEIKQLRFEPTVCICSSDGNCSDYEIEFYYVYGYQDCMKIPNELYPHQYETFVYRDIGARAFIHHEIDNLPPVFKRWSLIATISTALYTAYLLLFAVFVEERSQYQTDDKAIPS